MPLDRKIRIRGTDAAAENQQKSYHSQEYTHPSTQQLNQLHSTPTMAPNKNRTSSQANNSIIQSTATRPNTHKNGTSIVIEELQEIKDPQEGRKFLEQHTLLCPPGESPLNQ